MKDQSWINNAADSIANRFMCTLGERNEIASLLEAEYLKCPLCKGEAGKVQVDETGDDQWHSCEECHGSGKRFLEEFRQSPEEDGRNYDWQNNI